MLGQELIYCNVNQKLTVLHCKKFCFRSIKYISIVTANSDQEFRDMTERSVTSLEAERRLLSRICVGLFVSDSSSSFSSFTAQGRMQRERSKLLSVQWIGIRSICSHSSVHGVDR